MTKKACPFCAGSGTVEDNRGGKHPCSCKNFRRLFFRR